MTHAGKTLVETLVRHGVRRISCVAGESYLPVLDALVDYPEVEVITCRQEGGAAFMAESWGKLTGEVGVCMVTRGPGACNAAIGIHTAKQDSTPLIVFVGQVTRHEKGREAFQEFDTAKVFTDLAKWACDINHAKDIPHILNQAFKIAQEGRPGPVVIGLPEDMLREPYIAPKTDETFRIDIEGGSASDIKKFTAMVSDAKKPLVILGGSGWSNEACYAFENFAGANKIPVITAWRRDDLFTRSHESYAGDVGLGNNPKVLEAIAGSDLVIAFGARLDSITTQDYSLPLAPKHSQKLIHVYADKKELGRVYKPDLVIHAHPAHFARQLEKIKLDGTWPEWTKTLHQNFLDWYAIDESKLSAWQGADMTAIFAKLRDLLPKDAIIAGDAGNFSGWVRRYLNYGRPGRLLAPLSGAMGYGVPAAIGASLAQPDKMVVGFCGDGGFMMNGQELATAIHHDAKPIIIICNNNMYGTIRMHQERDFPGRQSATSLTNPDFVKLAESYGAFGVRVERAADFENAFSHARKAGRVAVIEIRMDPRQLTTMARLG